MAVVIFDPPTFRAMYAQFAALDDAVLQQAFNMACLLFGNSDASRWPFEPGVNTVRETLLYMLTCHILGMSQGAGGMGGTGGVTSSASQGSVSVSFAVPANPDDAWFTATQCGALFDKLVRKKPKARYRAGRCH